MTKITTNNLEVKNMLIQPTIDKQRALKLNSMANALAQQLETPLPDLDFESRLKGVLKI